MSNTTDVFINSWSTQAQITAAGINASLINQSVTETIIGIPGTTGIKGADGVPGAKGDPGEGLPIGGGAGQIALKQSITDFDLAWSDSFTIDPATGNVGIGQAPDNARLSIKGINNNAYSDYALKIKNASGSTGLSQHRYQMRHRNYNMA